MSALWMVKLKLYRAALTLGKHSPLRRCENVARGEPKSSLRAIERSIIDL